MTDRQTERKTDRQSGDSHVGLYRHSRVIAREKPDGQGSLMIKEEMMLCGNTELYQTDNGGGGPLL